MIKVWQAKDGLPDDMLCGPLGYSGGFLYRRHAQHSMRRPKRIHVSGPDQRTGDWSSIETHLSTTLQNPVQFWGQDIVRLTTFDD
jgi:hypothetical protein